MFLQTDKKYEIDRILCLGDLINPAIANILAKSHIPVHMVWGNNDGDKASIISKAMQSRSNLTIGIDTYDVVEIDKRRIFMTHYPILVKHIAKSGNFDAVFYGHDHKKSLEYLNNTLIMNPGEISSHKTGLSTYGIYDTKTNKAEIIEVKGFITIKTKEVDEYLADIDFEFSKSKTHKKD